MTRLIITPIDLAAPGSHAERKRVLRALAQIATMNVADGLDALEALVVPRLQTDDGSPVEEALEQLSANEFDSLASALAGGETIPNAKSEP